MTLHTKLSYFKSLFRILGFMELVYDLKVGVMFLIVAEMLGIVEELPKAYVGTKTQ